mmetsp:Transcript_31780/g.83070  ORF Transcript_31780/g.83070 Transcript_31780/m.83070 type:complete len:204 (-) Transcript_31780:642-1253(-)
MQLLRAPAAEPTRLHPVSSGSLPPRKKKHPGFFCRKKAKSSPPMIGKPSPVTLAGPISLRPRFPTRAAWSAWLLSTGYIDSNEHAAVAPKALHVPCTIARARATIVSYVLSLRSRIVPWSSTVSGITLETSPPCTMVTERTACSRECTFRLTTDCNATMTCAAVSTGSTDMWGCDPWPPRPLITILKLVGCAMIGPAQTANLP